MPGEILPGYVVDICSVLWDAGSRDMPAMKLSEIHELAAARCQRLGKEPPALTTVSGYLRNLVEKGVLRQVEITESMSLEAPQVRVRGVRGESPPRRSPNTGYQAVAGPQELLQPLFKDLADAFPSKDRLRALIDFARALELPEDQRGQAVVELARALGLPEKTVQKLEKTL
jgi:hypothetical protein